MYGELFHLTEPPFRLSPDPQFLFASKQHARAKAYMESTIWLADGFVVITGDIGSGKTTLIESFLDELPEDVVLAQVTQTQITPVQFLQTVLVEFGFRPFKMRKVELIATLKDFLVEQYAASRRVLLIVDEAQNLWRKVLEEVRLLSGIESKKEKVLRIILAGQPELNTTLNSPRLEQLTQRVRLRFHLGPLSKRETREYIQHRLDVAGAEGRSIFLDETFPLIFRYSGGVPRLINTLCDTALLCGFAEESSQINKALVRSAIEELQWENFETRSRRHAIQASSATTETGNYSLAKLEVIVRGQLVLEQELHSGRTVIGRTADNELQIRSKFVSRHHAQIVTDLQECLLEDLNSTNGIFIGKKRVKRRRLSDGDEFQIGEHRLLYRDLRQAGFEEDLLDDEDDLITGENPLS
ncbi:MAG: AAA family ATPase [Gammaproteobacteria bacterium]